MTDFQLPATVRSLGVFRPADFEALGIPRKRLYDLLAKGRVERLSRGLYVATHHAFTEHHALAQVVRRVPGAVVCLLSALRFHGLTTQAPRDVWIAIPEKSRRPRLDAPNLTVCRFAGTALTEGVDTHVLEGVQVRVTSPARTVADCFRYRNKIGIDVAVEALKDLTRIHRGDANELARFARLRHVDRIMRPYLDALS